MRGKWMFIVPLAILGILLVIAIGGGVVMLLWNWLVPPLFGWPQVTFWQAFGLLALCRILFGGSGMKGSYRSHHTPEERERMRQAFRRRFGFGPGEPSGAAAPRE